MTEIFIDVSVLGLIIFLEIQNFFYQISKSDGQKIKQNKGLENEATKMCNVLYCHLTDNNHFITFYITVKTYANVNDHYNILETGFLLMESPKCRIVC